MAGGVDFDSFTNVCVQKQTCGDLTLYCMLAILWWLCRDNGLGAEGAASIAQYLATNTTLTKLDLS